MATQKPVATRVDPTATTSPGDEEALRSRLAFGPARQHQPLWLLVNQVGRGLAESGFRVRLPASGTGSVDRDRSASLGGSAWRVRSARSADEPPEILSKAKMLQPGFGHPGGGQRCLVRALRTWVALRIWARVWAQTQTTSDPHSGQPVPDRRSRDHRIDVTLQWFQTPRCLYRSSMPGTVTLVDTKLWFPTAPQVLV